MENDTTIQTKTNMLDLVEAIDNLIKARIELAEMETGDDIWNREPAQRKFVNEMALELQHTLENIFGSDLTRKKQVL